MEIKLNNGIKILVEDEQLKSWDYSDSEVIINLKDGTTYIYVIEASNLYRL